MTAAHLLLRETDSYTTTCAEMSCSCCFLREGFAARGIRKQIKYEG